MKTVYLVFRTDVWHSYASRELVYIGDDLDDTITQIEAHTECTEKQAEQLREYGQSQCNEGVDHEFDLVECKLNTFV